MPPRGGAKAKVEDEVVVTGEGTQGTAEEPSNETVVEPPEDHIAANERYLERIAAIAESAEFESGSLVGDIRDVLLELFKARDKQWSGHSESEQRDLGKTLENVAKTLLRKVVIVVAEEDRVSVHATLKGYSAKGDVFKLSAEARGDEDTAIELFRMDGHDVVIMSADATVFTGQRREADFQPDQPALGLQAPEAEDDEEEETVVEGVKEPEAHPLATGDVVNVNNYGALAVRVNIKTGMIEAQSPNQDEWNVDVREATPAELAAERERTADFSEEENPNAGPPSEAEVRTAV